MAYDPINPDKGSSIVMMIMMMMIIIIIIIIIADLCNHMSMQ